MTLKISPCLVLVLLIFTSAATSNSQVSPPVKPEAAQAEKTQSASDAEKQLDALNAEVFKYFNEGQYPRAMPLAERALDLGERTFGASDSRLVTPLVNLAELKLTVAKFREGDDAKMLLREAEALYRRAVTITEATVGKKDAQNSQIWLSLAQIYRLQKQERKVEEAFSRAIQVNESAFGTESLEVANAAYMLAEFHHSNKEPKKANPLYLRAIAIYDARLPEGDRTGEKAVERYECFLLESRGHDAIDEFRKKRPLNNSVSNEGIINGKAIHLPTPYYTQALRSQGLSGPIAVRVTISETGQVLSARAVCGNFDLIKLIKSAVFRARFTPTLKDGRPIKVTGIIIYNFEK